LQAIADANDGTRATGTPGYAESVDYVADTLEAAGYQVELDPFDFEFLPPATLQQLTPFAATYETGAFTGSGFGEVTGPVIPVDLALDPPRASTSGAKLPTSSGSTSPAPTTSPWFSGAPASSRRRPSTPKPPGPRRSSSSIKEMPRTAWG
jgi:hypothetical protein